MNNDDVIALFLAQRAHSARNGRGNLTFENGVLRSYDDVLAVWHRERLLVNSDVLSPTSSRHQSAVRKIAQDPDIIPDLGTLVEVFSGSGVTEYILQRKLAIGHATRKLAETNSQTRKDFFRRQIVSEKKAARIACRYLPLDEGVKRRQEFL